MSTLPRMITIVLFTLHIVVHIGAAPSQQVFTAEPYSEEKQLDLWDLDGARSHRKLRGRFLHLTDMHPDPYYRVDASQSSACHRKKPKKEKDRAGYYGKPYGDCDSPFTLTNFTLDFLEKHWSDEIDFVVWTGDSARHDNDRKNPRTPDEIYELNRALVKRMNEVFTSRGVLVVPTIGNNDVWPHNIMSAGPNQILNEYSDIWRSFIPFASYQVFQRGGYFTVEVVPEEIAVISLNTMYFYDSNKAVGGCEYKELEDPGNLELDWLEVQLNQYRDRNMQVWLIGHVPPSSDNYFPGCFVRYADLSLRFQDTILGHLYGHMNIDHFFYIDQNDLILPSSSMGLESGATFSQKSLRTKSQDTLIEELYKTFEALHKVKLDLDQYAIINVSPSVVPNPYLPSFRVYSYNITLINEDDYKNNTKKQNKVKKSKRHHHRHKGEHREEPDCKQEQNKDTWACRPKKPYHVDPDSPSRRNQLWSPLGYAQYWMPGLGSADKRKKPKFELEYLTYTLPSLYLDIEDDNDEDKEKKEAGAGKGKKERWYPVPLKELPKILREGKKKSKKYLPYKMKDLTIGSWLKMATKLGDVKRSRLRKRFEEYMYMGGEEE